MTVAKIALFIHPLYFALEEHLDMPIHRVEAEYLEKWVNYITELAKDPNTILVCFSNLADESTDAEKSDQAQENIKISRMFLDNITDLFGKNRTVILPKYARPLLSDEAFSEVMDMLSQSELGTLEHSEKETKGGKGIDITSFGEFEKKCVAAWTDEMQETLSAYYPELTINTRVEKEMTINNSEWKEAKNNLYPDEVRLAQRSFGRDRVKRKSFR